MNKMKEQLDSTVKKRNYRADHGTKQADASVNPGSQTKLHGNIRLCNLTKLNNNVQREYFSLSSVDYVLGQIPTGARIFSKLNTKTGFLYKRLAKKFRPLIIFITLYIVVSDFYH